MKLMIFAIDALPPDIVRDNIEHYPNMKKLIDKGTFCDYEAYTYGYGSMDNWISLYTGLEPEVHGCIKNYFRDENRYPNLNDFCDKNPFWEELNKKNISVGLWRAIATSPVQSIDGYMIGGEVFYEKGIEIPYCSIDPVVHENDKWILNELEGELRENPYPKSFKDKYNNLNKEETEKVVSGLLEADYFKEGYEFLKEELKYYKTNITNVYRRKEVDVCFFYTSLIDFIGHFQMHDTNKDIIKKAIKEIDNFIGEIIKEIGPQNVIVLSDHGMTPWHEHFEGYDRKVQEELFGLSEDAFWLKNGAIVIEGRNGGLLSACHGSRGTFIGSGPLFRNKKIKDMRTVDFYPTLLEMFDIEVPDKRQGKVLDILTKKRIKNEKIFLEEEKVNYKNIAIIQNIDIPQFNIIINKVFLNNRFSKIDVYGEYRYKNAIMFNTKVDKFYDINSIDKKEMFAKYDIVIIPYFNKKNGELNYYTLK